VEHLDLFNPPVFAMDKSLCC